MASCLSKYSPTVRSDKLMEFRRFHSDTANIAIILLFSIIHHSLFTTILVFNHLESQVDITEMADKVAVGFKPP